MEKKKVLYKLGEWTADPFDSDICMKLINYIEEETPIGKIILRLIRYAEDGAFK